MKVFLGSSGIQRKILASALFVEYFPMGCVAVNASAVCCIFFIDQNEHDTQKNIKDNWF